MKVNGSIRMTAGDEIKPHVTEAKNSKHVWLSIEQQNGSQSFDIYGDDAAQWDALAKTAAHVAKIIRGEQ